MSKTQEFKVYGSIRKMKAGGACGVILALAMLGMVFSSSVSADEVSVNASKNKMVLEVPIIHEKLDKAVAEAKEAGVKVEVGTTQDKGVATTDTVSGKQKEIEADYAKQEKDVKTVTVDYSSRVDKTTKEREEIEKENKAKQLAYEKAVDKHEADVKRIEAENNAILADNAKKEAENKLENVRIERDNAQKEAKYNKNLADQKAYNEKVEKENADLKADYDKDFANYEKELAEYNKKTEELAKKGVKAEKSHIKVYGDYDESQRGSVNYYKKMTASFEGLEGLMKVKDYIGLHTDSSISGSREGLLSFGKGLLGEIRDPKAGDSFTIHNVAENDKGQKISARFTFNKVEQEWVENGKPLTDTKIKIYEYDKDGSINFNFWNLVEFNPKIEFFLEKNKQKAILTIASMFNDIDYGQELRLTYEDGTEGIVLNPKGSDVKKVKRDGKDYYKGEYKTAWTYDVPDLGVKAGDLGYTNVNDEADIPRGSILSVGYGSTLNLFYHNGVGVHSQSEIDYVRKKAKNKALKEGKAIPSDKEIFSSTNWAVGIFGKASATVPVWLPVPAPKPPVLKQKDTKEIPKPKLEKPKEFVPRTTLPTPPAPTPPEKKKVPEMPLVPTVKVNYSRLRVTPSTPKPEKAITDNFGRKIDGANTFDKNVKFSLTTNYKPYTTFTADSKDVAKTWAMVDDVQDGAYVVDDSKITMKDSTGKDVKALFNMYHVLSEKQRTKEVQNILKEAGLNPKGEFYMFVAKDSASFYKNYVKQAKNITFDLPARLLVGKGEIVKNDFHQIDFGNGYVSNLVTVQVPELKPEKHALDQKDDKKIRDGQEIQIGEYLRYLLDGVTVPAKHDTLYQYDGIDKLDVKHDRYTGNWKGIIRGTEYVAEKDLVLPYDVVLKDGKVVKAGDKIAKGSSYAFTFEFNQGTNSEFIKKLVTVKWEEKEGKWSYSIDKDFLNSLGVKGTFDADFYLEVERIAAGKVENTFINTVNLQEMTAKVTTTTPEPPKPEPKEPHKPQPQASLPNTGTAVSMLPTWGMFLGLLSLAGAGLRKHKK
ncbi:SspB-related isopeptide-forming adhesin [Streptococcus oralis]|uniref:SspB-related isopeptide-forming adhesin n=1 Tax=Streptococcus oralis TaxID=1303 RepID=UPI000779022D|nr:SspB-related isopeptide-forming adhesin [Streptococcus oralis]